MSASLVAEMATNRIEDFAVAKGADRSLTEVADEILGRWRDRQQVALQRRAA